MNDDLAPHPGPGKVVTPESRAARPFLAGKLIPPLGMQPHRGAGVCDPKKPSTVDFNHHEGGTLRKIAHSLGILLIFPAKRLK